MKFVIGAGTYLAKRSNTAMAMTRPCFHGGLALSLEVEIQPADWNPSRP